MALNKCISLSIPIIAAAICVSAAVVAAPSVARADIGTFGPYGVTVKRPIKYASPGADTLTECKPVARSGHFNGPRPAILLIHGGAWSGGTSSVGPGYTGYSGSWCRLWASWGFDAFSVGYRLTWQARWPAQIIDVQAAIRWVRANAGALHVNPKMITVNGDSAGGQLAMIAGYNARILPGDLAGDYSWINPQPQVIISQFGPWTFGPYRPYGTASVRAEDHARQIMLDSADGRTTSNTPNTLFVQGTRDRTVNQCSQSEPAFRYLRAHGRPASYLSYNGGHEFTGMNGSTWASVVGDVQVKTISYAYAQVQWAGVLPYSEPGPKRAYTTNLPWGCP